MKQSDLVSPTLAQRLADIDRLWGEVESGTAGQGDSNSGEHYDGPVDDALRTAPVTAVDLLAIAVLLRARLPKAERNSLGPERAGTTGLIGFLEQPSGQRCDALGLKGYDEPGPTSDPAPRTPTPPSRLCRSRRPKYRQLGLRLTNLRFSRAG